MYRFFKIAYLLPFALLLFFCQQQQQAEQEQAEQTSETPMTGTTSPEGAMVYFISPQDGETVSDTFTVRFGLKGMGVAPAGVQHENTGHHHLLINYSGLPDMNVPMPASDSLIHYGTGATETEIALEPGQHTLQLILGDFSHTPHDPPVISDKITITVE